VDGIHGGIKGNGIHVEFVARVALEREVRIANVGLGSYAFSVAGSGLRFWRRQSCGFFRV